MAADKVPTVTESALTNNNKRTLLSAILAPGATTFPHYHTLFSETFTLLSGSLTVYASSDLSEASLKARTLNVGESATVTPGQLHYFLVGDKEARVKMTFEPGTVEFERAVMIMRGTQKDGVYQGYDDLVFMAVLSELTNSTAVGQMKETVDGLYREKGEEIRAKKVELLEKYASDEQVLKGGDE